MKNVIYFVVILFATAIILTGLFLYNRGNSKELNAQLKIGDNVTVDVTKATTKPLDSAKNYIILYVQAQNNSNEEVNLRQEPPTDPCANLKNTNYNNYNYDQPSPAGTASPVTNLNAQNNYQICVQGEAYKAYIQNMKEYQQNSQNPNAVELWTPKNQKCDSDASYTINQRYPNIGQEVTDYYFSRQARVGTLVYQCPEKDGNFTLKYNNEEVTLPL
jgi:hypothetical protein